MGKKKDTHPEKRLTSGCVKYFLLIKSYNGGLLISLDELEIYKCGFDYIN